MRFLVAGIISGLVTSVIVTWWPPAWLYAPGIIFGIAVSLYFAKDVWRASKNNKTITAVKLTGFVGLSYCAYIIALIETEWILGTNGFATFQSYGSSAAQAALFVGSFVGGCIGSFVLAVGMRLFFFRFDIIRGLFLFALFSGELGSLIIVGFELFGFIPQFLFPAWYVGVIIVTQYLQHMDEVRV